MTRKVPIVRDPNRRYELAMGIVTDVWLTIFADEPGRATDADVQVMARELLTLRARARGGQ